MQDLNRNLRFYSVGEERTELLSRNEIDEKYKWNLSDIYENEELWESDFKWIENNINEFKKFEGTLAESPERLLSCLKFDDEVGIKFEQLYLYAMLSKDSDLRVTKYQAMDDRIKTLYSKVQQASSFIRPELLNIPDEKLLQMVDSKKELKIYRHNIENLIRTKLHTLKKHEEEILALASEVTSVPYNAYSMFTNADMKFPKVKDEQGREIEISHARFYAAIYSKDREL